MLSCPSCAAFLCTKAVAQKCTKAVKRLLQISVGGHNHPALSRGRFNWLVCSFTQQTSQFTGRLQPYGSKKFEIPGNIVCNLRCMNLSMQTPGHDNKISLCTTIRMQYSMTNKFLYTISSVKVLIVTTCFIFSKIWN